MTKNGRGRYIILAIEDFEKNNAIIRLMSELVKGEKSGKEKGWLSVEEVENSLGISSD